MLTKKLNPNNQQTTVKRDRYSVEYFHIYTDDEINNDHQTSLEYLRSALSAWDFKPDLIILIDNYNPLHHKLSQQQILNHLENEGLTPDNWAFEADLIDNAQKLLKSVTDAKLKRNYERYIEKHKKYPCSLLTASWYLTRLGQFDGSIIRSGKHNSKFVPADRLVNILPEAYKPIEVRARELLLRSHFSSSAHKIQNLFYPSYSYEKPDLF